VTESIPDFDNPVVDEAFVQRKRHLRPEFADGAVNTVAVSPELQMIPALNVPQTLDDKQFVEAYVILAAHLATALKGINRVIRARKARHRLCAEDLRVQQGVHARPCGDPARRPGRGHEAHPPSGAPPHDARAAGRGNAREGKVSAVACLHHAPAPRHLFRPFEERKVVRM
jgi:hypothetical protein